MASWEHFGEIANVAQLAGFDAVRLIAMIVKAASTARMHKKSCRQFAQHLKLIGNLLEQLKISELKKYPETREPLEQLEDALRRSYILVNSCQERSYLYVLAMGWNIVYQFRKAQSEIDRYLKIVPLITLVDNARVRERLEVIEKDQHEYTLDEEDRRVQDENEKLRLELQRSQANYDVKQCEVIQHLLDVTEVAASIPDKSSSPKVSKKVEYNYSDVDNEKGHSYYDNSPKKPDSRMTSRNTSSVSSGHDLLSDRGSHRYEEWNADLLGCFSEPSLYIGGTDLTVFLIVWSPKPPFSLQCPCIIYYENSAFLRILTSRVGLLFANLKLTATPLKFYFWLLVLLWFSKLTLKLPAASAEACNELMAYSLILSCCCYTCCVRRKLRKALNITGGFVDDFLSHLMCCCCALVQEWREVEIRGIYGPEKTKTSPPPSQFMES
ncbi:hypothetical protein CXB51_008853 [Gossypium anomalum]|uniref:MCAfunc domain-containing protein n=1 Tax=Gossypium anomalum TaxID=47600 RepID=A0A8J6D8H0_9ROSI|nr:hypothetical protein CXB51_008853 [Gossypium anomalum]